MASRSSLVISWLLRLLLTALFGLSAVSKMAGIDHFEVYIYSFGFLPLTVCFLAARLLIGLELLLGLLLFVGWFPRFTRLATLGTLLLFTLFLCYATLVGRSDSCQCFGQWIHMNPTQSLLKNAILIALTLWHFHLNPRPLLQARWWLLVPAAIGLLAAPFVVSVPDNWAFGHQAIPYNEAALDGAMLPGRVLEARGVGIGRRVVAFVTNGCPYCQIARKKLNAIVSRHAIDPERVVFVLPSDITPSLFLDITQGARPLVLLMDGKQVLATYHSRNIDERQIAAFLAD